MDLRSPKTFNEKLNYLKLNDRNPLGPRVADKIAVRSYVKELIGPQYLIPLIGTYKRIEEVPFANLPSRFVLKTNHGSGWNLVCENKDKVDWNSEKRKFNYWLSLNAYYLSREWQYQSIKPALICEEMLQYEIIDYKLFCSKGKVRCIQVDRGRFSQHQRNLYDPAWNLLPLQIRYPQMEEVITRPIQLDEMIEIAEKLAQAFLFCRIDLYEQENQLYFGELTLHPGGGAEPFGSYQQDLQAGQFIEIT